MKPIKEIHTISSKLWILSLYMFTQSHQQIPCHVVWLPLEKSEKAHLFIMHDSVTFMHSLIGSDTAIVLVLELSVMQCNTD